MKRKLLPLLIAGLTIGATSAAFAGGPTVYGKVNVSMNKYDLQERDGTEAVDQKDNWEMESNASRIGVKGDFDISTNLKAIYKLEYEVYVDDGDDGSEDDNDDSNSSEFNQRNIYGGLQGNWGTLIAGKNDTPLKLVQEDIDQFNDLPIGDIKNIMVGENRESNIVMYTSPDFSGFALTISAMPGEDSGLEGDDDNDGLADAQSLALTYKAKSFYVGLAADQNVQNTDTVRLAGAVTLGPVELGAIYQTAEVNDEDVGPTINSRPQGIRDFTSNYDEQDAWIVSGKWEFVKDWALKAQYGMSESTPVTTGFDDTELTMIALGVDYKLNKNSKLFAYYASVEGEGDSAITDDTIEDKTFAVGYELKF
jgi:predicted porin